MTRILRAVLFFGIYQLLQSVCFPGCMLFILYRESFGRPFVGSWKERWGGIPKAPSNKKVLWLHAVSVGEMLSLEAIIASLKKQHPDVCCYLTVGTPAAYALAQRRHIADLIAYMPFDFLFSMVLGFYRIKPSVLFIVEAERWPNLLSIASLLCIPIYGLNAKISERSLQRYKAFLPIAQWIFGMYTMLFVQSPDEQDRLRQLHVPVDKIIVLGDLKALNVVWKFQQIKPQLLIETSPTTILAGSIHPGEAPIILDAFTLVKKKISTAVLILAPRHFHWMSQLRTMLEERHMRFVELTHNSAVQTAALLQAPDIDVIVIHEIGQLFHLYGYATVFILGGTFIPIGGHNLLEPAVWGRPIIMGPFIENCKTAATALIERKGALKTTVNPDDMAMAMLYILIDHQQQAVMKKETTAWLAQEAQAVDRVVQRLIRSI